MIKILGYLTYSVGAVTWVRRPCNTVMEPRGMKVGGLGFAK